MQNTKTNYEMKQTNFKNVFKTIQRYSSISRRELQKLTNLSWGSISAITSNMISNGLIEEKLHKLGSAGRSPQVLSINNRKNRILGISISTITFTIALCDLGGQVLQTESIFFDNIQNIEFSLFDKYVKKYFTSYDNISMVALSTQSATNKNSILLTNDLDNPVKTISTKSLKDYFLKNYNVPFYLFNSPECLLNYTLTKISIFREVKNCLILQVNADNLGLSAMVDGTIYKGYNNSGIQIEHTNFIPNGVNCKCGKNGCTYNYCTIKGLCEQQNNFQFDEMMNELKKKKACKNYNEIFQSFSYYLSLVAQNLINLFNPEYLFISGEITEFLNYFENSFYNNLGPLYKNRVFITSFEPEHPAIGAVLCAINLNLDTFLFNNAKQ